MPFYNPLTGRVPHWKGLKTMTINEINAIVTEALPHGVLLNTNHDKFNSMVIGWGHAGIIWGLPTFAIYVRQSRYTKHQLDATGVFTISSPKLGDRLSPQVMRVCGSQSGRDVDKASLFTLVPGRQIEVPAIQEYPVTLECKVLYRQDQDLGGIPEAIRDHYYSRGNDLGDFHTAYIGQIVDAYVL